MEELQPTSWRVWAGKVEREGKGGPWTALEERIGFVDIRVSPIVLLVRSGKSTHGGSLPTPSPEHLALIVSCGTSFVAILTTSAGQTEGICRVGQGQRQGT